MAQCTQCSTPTQPRPWANASIHQAMQAFVRRCKHSSGDASIREAVHMFMRRCEVRRCEGIAMRRDCDTKGLRSEGIAMRRDCDAKGLRPRWSINTSSSLVVAPAHTLLFPRHSLPHPIDTPLIENTSPAQHVPCSLLSTQHIFGVTGAVQLTWRANSYSVTQRNLAAPAVNTAASCCCSYLVTAVSQQPLSDISDFGRLDISFVRAAKHTRHIPPTTQHSATHSYSHTAIHTQLLTHSPSTGVYQPPPAAVGLSNWSLTLYDTATLTHSLTHSLTHTHSPADRDIVSTSLLQQWPEPLQRLKST